MKLLALRTIPNSVGMIQAGQSFHTHDEHGQQLIASGHARADDGTIAPGSGIRWPGATVVILASGPSLSIAQCDAVRAWRQQAANRRVIAINTTFRRAPWADVLYACDAPWWRLHHAEVTATVRSELWTQDKEATRAFAVRHIESAALPGLGRRPGLIHQGGNSGYQAINLASQAGVAKIILLGYDMHGTHWHGRYENGLPNTAPHLFETWIANAKLLAADLAKDGIEVVNCTEGSALPWFTKASLADTLDLQVAETQIGAIA